MYLQLRTQCVHITYTCKYPFYLRAIRVFHFKNVLNVVFSRSYIVFILYMYKLRVIAVFTTIDSDTHFCDNFI